MFLLKFSIMFIIYCSILLYLQSPPLKLGPPQCSAVCLRGGRPGPELCPSGSLMWAGAGSATAVHCWEPDSDSSSLIPEMASSWDDSKCKIFRTVVSLSREKIYKFIWQETIKIRNIDYFDAIECIRNAFIFKNLQQKTFATIEISKKIYARRASYKSFETAKPMNWT